MKVLILTLDTRGDIQPFVADRPFWARVAEHRGVSALRTSTDAS
ncbi:hypothetical protein [Tenggerimyces flavus]|uniref:Uncharacterized protein n=1 Tax=Tenggerimyces flavus TaxID=1708749 RepID=A0ABV7Y974_9ACTN|nr:hypothetical protein [Tenggerimyces flavus]MBM7786546.1 hypothetical protein [Tenggerimyces flavus]